MTMIHDVRDELEHALAMLKKPEDICVHNLKAREFRQGIDLVEDCVQVSAQWDQTRAVHCGQLAGAGGAEARGAGDQEGAGRDGEPGRHGGRPPGQVPHLETRDTVTLVPRWQDLSV